MLRFISKLILLVLLVLGASFLIRSLVPTYFAGPVIYNKSQVWEQEKDKYEFLFLGTSRINHGIDPSSFDKTYQDETGLEVQSFNFGISGASAGEVFFVLNDLLSDQPKQLKTVVVELCSIGTSLGDKFCKENLHTNRNKYWLDKDSWGFSWKNTEGYADDFNSVDKYLIKKNYSINWVENLFNIGMLPKAMELAMSEYPAEKGLGENRDGYNNIQKLKDRGAKKARKGFLKSKRKLNETKRGNSIRYFDGKMEGLPTNQEYLDQLLDLIRYCESRSIELIFVAPPMMAPDSYAELAAVFFELPEKNRLNLSSASLYPELYQEENVWDGNHVNNKGAQLFTEKLAQQLAEKYLNK